MLSGLLKLLEAGRQSISFFTVAIAKPNSAFD
jgi:hypothetical protein